MLATVITFNVLAVVFALIAFRAPKVRQFDADIVKRAVDASTGEPAWDFIYEPDPELTALFMGWVGSHKCEEARRLAA